ncbi:MAG: DUF2993 domain-containing protein [Firmicutes bacterium]|jgi:hypothetical protein|nr:DUF2993 domain-containing protein [Bacillota bacterium]
MRGTRLAIGIAIVLVAFIASEVWIPGYVQRRIEVSVDSWFSGLESVAVRAVSRPALAMLAGRFDLLAIDIVGAKSDEIRISRVYLESVGARIPLRKFDPQSPEGMRVLGDARATLLLAEKDVNAHLAARDDLLRRFTVAFDRDQVRVLGRVSVVGFEVDVSSEGRFTIEEPSIARYTIEDLKVHGRALPDFVMDMLEERIRLGVDFSGLPFGFELRGVRVDEGFLYLFGETTRRG